MLESTMVSCSWNINTHSPLYSELFRQWPRIMMISSWHFVDPCFEYISNMYWYHAQFWCLKYCWPGWPNIFQICIDININITQIYVYQYQYISNICVYWYQMVRLAGLLGRCRWSRSYCWRQGRVINDAVNASWL